MNTIGLDSLSDGATCSRTKRILNNRKEDVAFLQFKGAIQGVIISTVLAREFGLTFPSTFIGITAFKRRFGHHRHSITPFDVRGTSEQYIFIPTEYISAHWFKLQCLLDVKILCKLSAEFSLPLMKFIVDSGLLPTQQYPYKLDGKLEEVKAAKRIISPHPIRQFSILTEEFKRALCFTAFELPGNAEIDGPNIFGVLKSEPVTTLLKTMVDYGAIERLVVSEKDILLYEIASIITKNTILRHEEKEKRAQDITNFFNALNRMNQPEHQPEMVDLGNGCYLLNREAAKIAQYVIQEIGGNLTLDLPNGAAFQAIQAIHIGSSSAASLRRYG